MNQTIEVQDLIEAMKSPVPARLAEAVASCGGYEVGGGFVKNNFTPLFIDGMSDNKQF